MEGEDWRDVGTQTFHVVLFIVRPSSQEAVLSSSYTLIAHLRARRIHMLSPVTSRTLKYRNEQENVSGVAVRSL